MIVVLLCGTAKNGEYTHTYRLTDKEIANVYLSVFFVVLCSLGWVHWSDLNTSPAPIVAMFAAGFL